MQTVSDRNIFLSTLPASSADRTAASAIVGISFVLFVFAVPFAGMPLTPVPGFCRELPVRACDQRHHHGGAAAVAVCGAALARAAAAGERIYVHGRRRDPPRPDLSRACLRPTGLLGAGPQTTVWVYMIWHGGFPLFVLGYALRRQEMAASRSAGPRCPRSSPASPAVIVAISPISGSSPACTTVLPTLLSQGRYTPAMIGVVSTVWFLSLAALFVLWSRQPHSVIDIWLMVVLCVWLFDIALSAILNVARFDLGFYAGRIYGLFAASFVLAVLLIDNVALQAQMSRLVRSMRREAAFVRDQHKVRERLFSAVVESSNDAIITKALDGTITGWNRAAERLFGYSADEAVGQHVDLIVPSHRREETDTLLERIRRGEAIEQFETVRLRKDGRRGRLPERFSVRVGRRRDHRRVRRSPATSPSASGRETALSRRPRSGSASSRPRRT